MRSRVLLLLRASLSMQQGQALRQHNAKARLTASCSQSVGCLTAGDKGRLTRQGHLQGSCFGLGGTTLWVAASTKLLVGWFLPRLTAVQRAVAHSCRLK